AHGQDPLHSDFIDKEIQGEHEKDLCPLADRHQGSDVVGTHSDLLFQEERSETGVKTPRDRDQKRNPEEHGKGWIFKESQGIQEGEALCLTTMTSAPLLVLTSSETSFLTDMFFNASVSASLKAAGEFTALSPTFSISIPFRNPAR